MKSPTLTVSDFVGTLNQTLEFAYPSVVIIGELANFRISKNKWVYFDLKDDDAQVKFFGSVYNLPGPLEDGMMLEVLATPRLHPQFGFSLSCLSIKPVGEGTIKKAASLLEAKLKKEGLFAPELKRPLPYPPARIGLVASSESAAYADLNKILNSRWSGLLIDLYDVQVQGVDAPEQLIDAIKYFNETADAPDVLVLIRGGGSPEDLAAFSHEQVVRAVAASRVPTLVAIGHEIDLSLAERAADLRASTPSNAAELLVPDKSDVLQSLSATQRYLYELLTGPVKRLEDYIARSRERLNESIDSMLRSHVDSISLRGELLSALNPTAVLSRGYAVVRAKDKVIKSARGIKVGDELEVEMADASLSTKVNKIRIK